MSKLRELFRFVAPSRNRNLFWAPREAANQRLVSRFSRLGHFQYRSVGQECRDYGQIKLECTHDGHDGTEYEFESRKIFFSSKKAAMAPHVVLKRLPGGPKPISISG